MMDEPIGRYVVQDGLLRARVTAGAAPPGSVYEVVRIIDGAPLFLEEHVGRLARSATLAGLPSDVTAPRLRKLVAGLSAACDIRSGNVRVVWGLSAPAQRPALLICFIKSRYPDDEMYKRGVRVGLMRGERSAPAVKRSDTPVRREADRLLEGGGFYEVLLVNGDGFITEGSRTNVFFAGDDRLVTPPAESVLTGITRRKVLEIAREDGIDVIEESVREPDIGGFRSIFLTGTSAKVLPVRSVGGRSFDVSHVLVRRLMESYDRRVESYLADAAAPDRDGSGERPAI
jgi:branched-chain amino acid aminotransferase